MKKKLLVMLLILLVIIFTIILGIGKSLASKKIFYDPDYNQDYISSINTINIQNEKINNPYQFVYISDLHASIPDDNEPDEKIRTSLIERNEMFMNQNSNKPEQIFPEIINYTNNKNADALLLGGDIIDSPSDSNINFLRENFKKLKTNKLYTFGNHDWTFAWDYQKKEVEEKYYPIFLEFMDDNEVSYIEYEDLIILAINNGKNQIAESAIPKVKEVLNKNKPTIVMLHVPIATEYISSEAIKIRNRVSAIGEPGIKPNENTKQVLDMLLSKNSNVFHIIAGHVHFYIEDTLNDNIIESVSSPAYTGSINVIKINN